MKTKFLAYSKCDMNNVVSRYDELTPINDKVYTYLYEKSPSGENMDLIGIVLKIENIYFQEGVYSRQTLQGRDIGKIGSDAVDNYQAAVEDSMQRGLHVQILIVKVYEALGWDAEPLLEYREKRKEKQETARKEKQRMAEIAALQANENERKRLEEVQRAFHDGEYINREDFISLCKQAEIDIPLRTHGTLNKSVVELSLNKGIRFYRYPKKASPDLSGCRKLIAEYFQKTTKSSSQH